MSHCNPARMFDTTGLDFSSFDPSPDQYLFVSDTSPSSRNERPAAHSVQPSQSGGHQHRELSSDFSPIVPFAGDSLCPPQASFTGTNMEETHVRDVIDTSVASPLQTRFNGEARTFEYESNSSFSTEEQSYSEMPTSPTRWPCSWNQETPMARPQQKDFRARIGSASSAIGKRGVSKKAEPGSARAVYLEKNRYAAGKCRTKQKRQQENLVETAREVQRKNKVLKSEVEFLTSDLRDLVKLVGKHNGCPDNRLRRYLEQEVDRFSIYGDRNQAGDCNSPRDSR